MSNRIIPKNKLMTPISPSPSLLPECLLKGQAGAKYLPVPNLLLPEPKQRPKLPARASITKNTVREIDHNTQTQIARKPPSDFALGL